MCQATSLPSPGNTTTSENAQTSWTAEDCPGQECEEQRVVHPGDVVTIDLDMKPENGLVPEPLFDRSGVITFVVGWGNYLPALHSLVKGKAVGERCENASIDAGWGDRNPDLVMELPKSKLQRFLQPNGRLPEVGSILNLSGGQIQLVVLETNEETESVVVDANPPLAGASYSCSFTILDIQSLPGDAQGYNIIPQQDQKYYTETSTFSCATFALGCFWGGELAFMRVPGVVGTRVGYTQGTVSNPTYQQVCTGKTRHREAILVIYDPQVVSYSQLMDVALDRLAATNTPNNNKNNNNNYDSDDMFGNLFAEEEEDEATTNTNQQYRHGFYFHSEEQRLLAEEKLSGSNLYDVEVKKAAVFYDAEPYHQQYLLKGGQSARKGAKETIRCYG